MFLVSWEKSRKPAELIVLEVSRNKKKKNRQLSVVEMLASPCSITPDSKVWNCQYSTALYTYLNARMVKKSYFSVCGIFDHGFWLWLSVPCAGNVSVVGFTHREIATLCTKQKEVALFSHTVLSWEGKMIYWSPSGLWQNWGIKGKDAELCLRHGCGKRGFERVINNKKTFFK